MTRNGPPTSQWPSLPPAAGAGEASSGDGGGPDPRASLLVRRPGLPEVRISVRNEMVIGRAATEADLVLDDDLVSRRHAVLRVDPRGYFRLDDLDSKNGIRFAERTVRKLNLVDGDVFHIGRTELVFSAEMRRLKPAARGAPEPVDALMNDTEIEVPEPARLDPGDGLDGIEQLGWKRTRRGDGPAPEPEEAGDPGSGTESG